MVARPGQILLSRALASGLLVAATLCVATGARAQDRSFSPQLFHPAPGPDEFVTIEAARPLQHKAYGLGLYLNYARNPFSIYQYDTTSMSTGKIISNVISNIVAA